MIFPPIEAPENIQCARYSWPCVNPGHIINCFREGFIVSFLKLAWFLKNAWNAPSTINVSDKTDSLIWSTSPKCISHLIAAVTLNIYQGQVSPLRAWWTGDVCASVLPLMWAPAQVCVTRSGPNGSFEACSHKGVSTNTQTLVTSDLNLKARGSLGECDELNRHSQTDRLTDWLILDIGCYWWHTKSLLSVCLICSIFSSCF